MRKLFYLLLLATGFNCRVQAQIDSFAVIYIANDTFISSVTHMGGTVIPTFNDLGINNIVNDYTFTVFERAYPASSYEYMHQYYKIKCSNTYVAQRLHTSYPSVFPEYTVYAPQLTGISSNMAAPVSPALFPNPASGVLHIAGQQVADVWACDVAGRPAAVSLSADRSMIDIATLPEGYYHFRLQYADGRMATQQVLVRHR